MEREKGFAYCGLACCICSENETCEGCRNDGCKDKEWCKNFNCCRERGLSGCWECSEFPCTGNMLDKMRIRAFARFMKEYGENKFLDCLEINEREDIWIPLNKADVGELSSLEVFEIIEYKGDLEKIEREYLDTIEIDEAFFAFAA